ncbi:DUF3578 domain-containing protein [Oceanihabitans sp. 2_MG-2023]|uniref:MrcB family domain-containing protein n=1 Tax=Oceanihabitans sp. 2_MG-2023 TaxID=3062661 RepID=UPI0026E14DEF|nr:DUF3578 domain-containing protein [Oceanihabitans sp. 2_MG-2023]MDO6596401.1 DUF3578 domain-containing protein [Oceanihabitans sp. 2_MG-2023]
MLFDEVSLEHIEKAVNHFRKNGIPHGLSTSKFYDVEIDGTLFPPKPIMAIANYFATGKSIDNYFSGGKGTPCFAAFERLKIKILPKSNNTDMPKAYEILNEFLKQAKTDNLKTKHYLKAYRNTKVKVSFGQGNTAKIPWVSFLKDPFTTSDGIYPVYLYYKNINKLILAYGRSETNKPIVEWNINNSLSISDFFKENNFEKPDRYGDSHVFKVYDVNNLPEERILNQDLDVIIEKYSNLGEKKNFRNNTFLTRNFEKEKFEEHCKNSGLNYKPDLITRYIASLATKPFVLLSGLSGSGKTKLAQAFAQWICESEEQYTLIPVGADWTNREPLLGYPNALKDNEYVKPDNDALDLLLRAKDDETKPYFLILDEMNLSHVERYFADFLSTMESKNSIPLHKIDNEVNKIPKTIKLPKNLFIVGTVNIDETTYMFSPKVLDRANTIEFRVSDTDISGFLKNPNDIDLDKLNGKGANMAINFVDIAKSKKEKDDNTTYQLKDSQQGIINDLFKELQKSGAEFGYRTAFEISKLIYKLEEFGLSNENDKLDIAIMQKMLPKLHGSRTKLTRTLKPLAKLCLVDVNDKFDKEYFENFGNIEFKKDVNIKYKLSFEKIMRMYKNAVENGFASYAEA